MRSAVLIYNPHAGRPRDRRHAASRMVDALRRRGVHAEARATTAAGDAERLSRDALAAGVETVIVHGGDGTGNEALQPLVGGTTALAVWPGGTANVLAQELGLPREVEPVADMIASGRTRQVSVGQAGQRYFLVMAGVGMDAAVVRAVNPALKRLAGQGAFWIAWVQHLVRWRPQAFVVDVDGQSHTATFAVLANAPAYGGGLRIAPHASLDSDCLDLCLFAWTDRHRFVRHLRASRGGGHLGLPGVSYLQARRATVSAPGSVWVQTDGELLGELPMTFECVPAALSVIVPG